MWTVRREGGSPAAFTAGGGAGGGRHSPSGVWPNYKDRSDT